MDGAKANVSQFPLALCFSSTAHKQQGLTVHKPNCLVTDLRSVFDPAQAHVILSRVKVREQLFLLEELPVEKIYADVKAIEEYKHMELNSVNKTLLNQRYNYNIKIACLNIRSLRKHFLDVKADHKLINMDLILLTETWLTLGEEGKYGINDYSANFNIAGQGKGIAGYARGMFSHQKNITQESFQISKFSHSQMEVICIYRSKSNNLDELLEAIKSNCDMTKVVIVIGDVNICYLTNKTNYFTCQLKKMGFNQIVNVPTHNLGGCIDHVYVCKPMTCDIDILLETSSPYYSDHDTIILNINIGPTKTERKRKGIGTQKTQTTKTTKRALNTKISKANEQVNNNPHKSETIKGRRYDTRKGNYSNSKKSQSNLETSKHVNNKRKYLESDKRVKKSRRKEK